MADEVATEQQTNGAAAPAKSRADAAAEDRAAFLAAVASGELGDDEPKGKPGKDAPKPADEDKDDAGAAEDDEIDLDEADGDSDDDEEEIDLDDEDEADDEDEDDEPGDKPDADTAKRLDKVRRAEKRSREALKAERASFERERDQFIAQVKPRLEKLERFEGLAGKVRSRPVEVLTELGLPVEDFEDAARALFAASPAGSKDPKNKDAAAARASRLELEAKVEALTKKLEERETNEQTAAQRAAQEQQLDTYFTRVEKKAGDETPLAKRRLAALPKKARAEITELTFRAAQKLGGKLPKPAAVMKLYEKQLTREKAWYGDEKPAAPAANGSKTKAKPANGDKTASAKPNGSATNGHKPFSQPSRDEMLAELYAGKDTEAELS